MTENYNYDTNDNLYRKKKKYYCSNCGKYGHVYKKCKEPITSIGIICVKLNNVNINELISYFKKNYEDEENNENINILNINNKNYNNLKFINYFKDKIEFLFIRRKHTLSYIEFIRGRYELSNIDHIVSLFELMSPDEITRIKNYDFKDLWHMLWKKTSCNKIYEKEYELSRKKFRLLKNKKDSNSLALEDIIKIVKPKFNTPEWGFPKGRRNYHEKNLDCAKREFSEETSYNSSDYYLLENINPINEIFNGTNGILYKHIYYIALDKSNKDAKIDNLNTHQIDEIGDIDWFTYNNAINKIRPYHNEKKKILNEIYLFLVNVILESNISNIKVSNNKSKVSNNKSKASVSKASDNKSKASDNKSKTSNNKNKASVSKASNNKSKTSNNKSKTSNNKSKTSNNKSKTSNNKSKASNNKSKASDNQISSYVL